MTLLVCTDCKRTFPRGQSQTRMGGHLCPECLEKLYRKLQGPPPG